MRKIIFCIVVTIIYVSYRYLYSPPPSKVAFREPTQAEISDGRKVFESLMGKCQGSPSAEDVRPYVDPSFIDGDSLETLKTCTTYSQMNPTYLKPLYIQGNVMELLYDNNYNRTGTPSAVNVELRKIDGQWKVALYSVLLNEDIEKHIEFQKSLPDQR